jgi:Zn-dependent metalloprotease
MEVLLVSSDTPTAAVDEAAARAVATARYAELAREPDNQLAPEARIAEVERVYFDPVRFDLPGRAGLAWRLRLDSVQVFVDAKDGHVIVAYDDRPTVRNRFIHDCNQTPNCTLVINEQGRISPAGPLAADATQVYDAAQAAHTYFKNTHDRDGYDDAGIGGTRKIDAFVQFRGLENARWSWHLERFEFGPGWTTVDITAHEYVHAMTTFGPALPYLGQPGAVSEFFSDFFGAMIERSVTGVLDWKIGEDLPGFSQARPLRNMASPHNAGFNRDADFDSSTNYGQPEDSDELVKPSHKICGSLRGEPPDFIPDNGCVHFNGGILSKALHLAIVGDTFKGTKVTAVALPKIERIMFRTLMLGGVTSSSNLLDTANGAVRGCRQLIGTFGIVDDDCTNLRTAFVAVKLKVAP